MDSHLVIQRVEDAWREVPQPRNDAIVTPDSYDDEDIVDYFGGTTWQGHHAADLRAHSSAFTFFTPVAWHYWLPAFIRAAIEEPEEADVCTERLAISIFDKYAMDRVPLLSASQRAALCDYFRFQIDRWPATDTKAEQKALKFLQ